MPEFRPESVSRAVVAMVLVAMLAACNTIGGTRPDSSFTDLMDRAEAEVGAGRVESAVVGFNNAARADPLRKEPWVRIAQLHFDAGNYGRAIVAAEEVLQRDAGDPVADSVLTVAGLRIAAQSLQRLQGNGAIASESARAEAGRLADAMRSTMGEDILARRETAAPRPQVRRRPAPPRPAASAAPASEPGNKIANPFGGIGG